MHVIVRSNVQPFVTQMSGSGRVRVFVERRGEFVIVSSNSSSASNLAKEEEDEEEEGEEEEDEEEEL